MQRNSPWRKTRLLLCLLSLAIPLLGLAASAAVYTTAESLDSIRHTALPAGQGAHTSPPATSAASYALLDPVSGEFYAERDANTRRPMASTTKIMTALVALERLALDEVVTVPAEAAGVEGSSVYLFAGEQISVRTLLYALMLSSANDAAAALAIHTAGSIEAFAALMNEKAAALQLQNTHFCNPHGLHHPEHYTTARDLARLTAAALENETFAEIVATKRYSAPQIGTEACRLFLNHNRLLRTLNGAVGVKTGFTKAGGRCLVSAARRDGLLLIAVTLNDPNDWRDHTALLDWGFENYVAFAPQFSALTLPVVGGTATTAALLPESTIRLTLPADHGEITCTVEAPRFLFAGFERGAHKGRIVYYMDGKVLAEVPLVTDTAVEALPTRLTLWDRVKNLFGK